MAALLDAQFHNLTLTDESSSVLHAVAQSLQHQTEVCEAVKDLNGALSHIMSRKPLPKTRAEIPLYSREILHL